MCPICPAGAEHVIKKGFFRNAILGRRRIQRYYCKTCGRGFSSQTGQLTYREKKPYIDQPMFRLLCSGVSQRRAAFIFAVKQKTIERKMIRLGHFAASMLASAPPTGDKTLVFDEMETFEHTKCKPVSIAVAVTEGERRILATYAASMPAKGHLAAISRKKYGFRKDDRKKGLRHIFQVMAASAGDQGIVKSDECPRYENFTRKYLPHHRHMTFKGRRGCVVGQGELKRGGYDPLFSLNHTCAMYRDNVKRLSRRTWCTTKKIDRLQSLLNLYATYHNQRLVNCRRPPKILSIQVQP